MILEQLQGVVCLAGAGQQLALAARYRAAPDIGGDDIGSVSVQRGAGAVVAHGRVRIGVRGGFLDIAERHPASRAAVMNACRRVCGPTGLVIPARRARRRTTRAAPPVQPLSVGTEEDRALHPLADGQVDGPRRPWRERDGDYLAAFASDHQGPVAAHDAQVLDVGACGFGDLQPVEGQQGDQCVLGGRAEPGGDQQRAEFVAVQPSGMGLIIQPRTADAGGREWSSRSSSTA